MGSGCKNTEDIKAHLREIIMLGCCSTAEQIEDALAAKDLVAVGKRTKQLEIGCMYLKLLQEEPEKAQENLYTGW